MRTLVYWVRIDIRQEIFCEYSTFFQKFVFPSGRLIKPARYFLQLVEMFEICFEIIKRPGVFMEIFKTLTFVLNLSHPTHHYHKYLFISKKK